jgi:hypothetical protein
MNERLGSVGGFSTQRAESIYSGAIPSQNCYMNLLQTYQGIRTYTCYGTGTSSYTLVSLSCSSDGKV